MYDMTFWTHVQIEPMLATMADHINVTLTRQPHPSSTTQRHAPPPPPLSPPPSPLHIPSLAEDVKISGSPTTRAKNNQPLSVEGEPKHILKPSCRPPSTCSSDPTNVVGVPNPHPSPTPADENLQTAGRLHQRQAGGLPACASLVCSHPCSLCSLRMVSGVRPPPLRWRTSLDVAREEGAGYRQSSSPIPMFPCTGL